MGGKSNYRKTNSRQQHELGLQPTCHNTATQQNFTIAIKGMPNGLQPDK